jgi:serine/threonine-protein kinase
LAGRYRVIREIGRGGMATVYLAHDIRHDRDVAIKVVRAEIGTVIGADRFLAEIRTTARLQHPHILPLFDSGTAAGRLFYVMPLVPGETLRDHLDRCGPLPVAEVGRIVAEVGSALDYAHRQGVIHRDLKPANIMLHEGSAMLADFGISLALSGDSAERLTETGLSIGTPQYMSPEQALGERDVTPQSDMYSLGVVAYELLTGVTPFRGTSMQAVVAQVITSSPKPVSAIRPDVPPSVSAAVLIALAKQPKDRHDTCASLAAAWSGSGALIQAAAAPAVSAPPARRFPMPAWRIAAGAGLLLVVALAWWLRSGRTGTPPELSRVVAVLPFTDITGDSANHYFSRGLSVEITDELHELGLNVVGSSSATAAAGRFRKGEDVDVQAAGKSLGADAVLDGKILRVAEGGRVSIELTDVNTQRVLWSDRYELGKDLFAFQDSVAQKVAEALRVTLSPARVAAVRSGRSVSSIAHDQVVRAKGYAERRDPAGLDQAIPLFTQAIRTDSTYAEAWAGLAEAYFLRAVFSDQSFGNSVNHSAYFDRAAAAASRALTLDSTSAAVHRVLGMLAVFHAHNWAAAQREFQASVALDSTQAATWLFRTWYYYGMDQRDSALWSVRRAWELDSLTPIYPTRLADVLRDWGDTAEARRILERTVRRNPADLIPRLSYAALLAQQGHCDTALALPAVPLHSTPGAQLQFEVWARCGHPELVRAELDSASQAARRGQWAHGVFLAIGAAMIRDTSQLERWLDYVATSPDYTAFFLRGPAFAEYQDNPHYRAALAALGLK